MFHGPGRQLLFRKLTWGCLPGPWPSPHCFYLARSYHQDREKRTSFFLGIERGREGEGEVRMGWCEVGETLDVILQFSYLPSRNEERLFIHWIEKMSSLIIYFGLCTERSKGNIYQWSQYHRLIDCLWNARPCVKKLGVLPALKGAYDRDCWCSLFFHRYGIDPTEA